jgi:hypothetical protein
VVLKPAPKGRGPTMLYVGMDISSKSFAVHAINQRKKVVLKREVSPIGWAD